MIFIQHYDSPLGGVLLAADEIGLRGLWFDGQKYFARDLPAERTKRKTPVLAETERWLDIYFSGKEPNFLPPLHPVGSAFRREVWELLLNSLPGRLRPTAKSRGSLQKRKGLPECRHRRSAERWVTMKFP